MHPSPICCHFACRLAYAARAPSARKHAQIRTHNNTDTSDKRQASVRTRTHARVRVRTLAKKKREKIKTRAHTHGTSLTHYIHTHVSRVVPNQGREKPKFTSFQLIILSASQPIGLYYLFTLYRCAPTSLLVRQHASTRILTAPFFAPVHSCVSSLQRV